MIQDAILNHELGRKTRDRLARMKEDHNEFLDFLKEKRQTSYKQRMEKWKANFAEKKEQRIAEIRRKKEEERAKRLLEEAEQLKREEIAKEEAAKRAAEEAEKQALEKRQAIEAAMDMENRTKQRELRQQDSRHMMTDGYDDDRRFSRDRMMDIRRGSDRRDPGATDRDNVDTWRRAPDDRSGGPLIRGGRRDRDIDDMRPPIRRDGGGPPHRSRMGDDRGPPAGAPPSWTPDDTEENWRRQASNEDDMPPRPTQTDQLPPRKTGAYVPPSLRAKMEESSGRGSSPRRGPENWRRDASPLSRSRLDDERVGSGGGRPPPRDDYDRFARDRDNPRGEGGRYGGRDNPRDHRDDRSGVNRFARPSDRRRDFDDRRRDRYGGPPPDDRFARPPGPRSGDDYDRTRDRRDRDEYGSGYRGSRDTSDRSDGYSQRPAMAADRAMADGDRTERRFGGPRGGGGRDADDDRRYRGRDELSARASDRFERPAPPSERMMNDDRDRTHGGDLDRSGDRERGSDRGPWRRGGDDRRMDEDDRRFDRLKRGGDDRDDRRYGMSPSRGYGGDRGPPPSRDRDDFDRDNRRDERDRYGRREGDERVVDRMGRGPPPPSRDDDDSSWRRVPTRRQEGGRGGAGPDDDRWNRGGRRGGESSPSRRMGMKERDTRW